MPMKISTRGRYGLKAIIDLAAHSDEKCVTIKSVSERIGVSEYYLEQLISPLKKAGFVKSIRGAQGGYVLKKPACEISVGDILRALEGSLSPVACLESDDEDGGCGETGCGNCVTRPVFEKIYSTLNDAVDSIMLTDLVKNYKEAGGVTK